MLAAEWVYMESKDDKEGTHQLVSLFNHPGKGLITGARALILILRPSLSPLLESCNVSHCMKVSLITCKI